MSSLAGELMAESLLLKKSQQGDVEALGCLRTQYHPALLNILRARGATASRAAAEERGNHSQSTEDRCSDRERETPHRDSEIARVIREVARRASSAVERRMGEAVQEDVRVHGRRDHVVVLVERWISRRRARGVVSGVCAGVAW